MPKARTHRRTPTLEAIFDRIEWVALHCYPDPQRIGIAPKSDLTRRDMTGKTMNLVRPEPERFGAGGTDKAETEASAGR